MLHFLAWLKDLVIFDCKIGLPMPNCMYYQPERPGGQKYCENPANGFQKNFAGYDLFYSNKKTDVDTKLLCVCSNSEAYRSA